MDNDNLFLKQIHFIIQIEYYELKRVSNIISYSHIKLGLTYGSYICCPYVRG